METITSADGTTIAYARTGSGPPLVLVHGTTADHTRWAPVLPGFEAAFSVYAMDRRGRGASGDGERYRLEREVEDVVALVESIGEPVVLLGHSFGACCAMEAALRTDHLRALVLYEPAFAVGDHELYPPALVSALERLLEAGEYEQVLERFLLEVADLSPAELDALRSAPNWSDRVAAAPTILRENGVEDAYEFDPERFADLATPTLLLTGSESAAFLRDATAALEDALPDRRLAVFEGHGHVAQSTAPALFVEAVLGFVRELDERAAKRPA